MLKNLTIVVLASLFLSSCLKGTDAGDMCNYDPCQFKASNNEIQAVQTYLTNNNIEAVQHCSGMFYKIENAGTGTTPGVCSSITVNYVGSLTNGNKFDESSAHGGPQTFILRQVVAGWQNGVPLIKEGGRIRLFIPPSLGYGNREMPAQTGYSGIPAGSILIFDVELKQVR
ncbi:MAG TPA: FKBP-type peptidyl-prolyl cis-trans isomerase [Flavisolibacter sp.]|nr:FKBP-type peptidyl-prolyl cis-trans isomerase [Flavisolibacter sp.]